MNDYANRMAELRQCLIDEGWNNIGAGNGEGETMLAGNKTYKVFKPVLLDKIRENREKHIAEYKKALEVFRVKAIEALGNRQIRARASDEFDLDFKDLPRPVSHQGEYDTVIGLLEMAVDAHIEITPGDYSQYVKDEWAWKKQFEHTNAFYSMER